MQSDQVRTHLPWLLIGLAVPLLAAVLVVDGERVAFFFLPNAPLPAVCLSRGMLGLDCPACGLTRSVVHLVHGRPAESLAMHRLGWLALLLVAGQVPFRAWSLAAGRNGPRRARRAEGLLWAGLAGLFILNWIWGLIAA